MSEINSELGKIPNYDPQAQGIQRGERLPLTEAEEADVNSFVTVSSDLLRGERLGRDARMQTIDPTIPTEDSRDENYRDAYWHRLSQAMDVDIEELLNREKLNFRTRITVADGPKLGLPLETDILVDATRRVAAFPTKWGVALAEEIEFPVENDGKDAVRRIMSVRSVEGLGPIALTAAQQ